MNQAAVMLLTSITTFVAKRLKFMKTAARITPLRVFFIVDMFPMLRITCIPWNIRMKMKSMFATSRSIDHAASIAGEL